MLLWLPEKLRLQADWARHVMPLLPHIQHQLQDGTITNIATVQQSDVPEHTLVRAIHSVCSNTQFGLACTAAQLPCIVCAHLPCGHV